MCETNESRPVCNRVWPPVDGAASSDIDEIWDDSELLEHYEQVELNVKAQVEAFRSGRASIPIQRRKRRTVTNSCKHNFPSQKSDPSFSESFHGESFSPQTEKMPHKTINSNISSVYPWLPPSTELPPSMPSLIQQSAFNPHCGCNHHARKGIVREDAVSITSTLAPQVSQNSPSNELNINALLRAWYEAGYAMGQAHAEQVLRHRDSKSCLASGDGDAVR